MPTEILEVRRRLVTSMTALAFHERVGAVEFYEALGTGAGKVVQAIDVLRHHCQELSGFLQLHNGLVNGIWAR